MTWRRATILLLVVVTWGCDGASSDVGVAPRRSPVVATPTPMLTFTRRSTPLPSQTRTRTHTRTETPTRTHTFTATNTREPSATPTATTTGTRTNSPRPSNTRTPLVSFTPTDTFTATATPTATATATDTGTATATGTPTEIPTVTATPTITDTPGPSPTATATATVTATLSIPPLGRRVFTLAATSGFFTSFLPTSKAGTPAGAMNLDASATGSNGQATISVSGPSYFTTVLTLGGVTLCTRVDSCTGTLYCDGGANVDVTETLDSLKPGLSCVRDGTNLCSNLPNSVCCSNSCEGVGLMGSGNSVVTAIGVNPATDSGNGALLLDCTQRSVQVNRTTGVDCAAIDYSAAAAAHQVYTTGNNAAVVNNHCAGSGAPGTRLPRFARTGANFDCAAWTTANGPGTLVFSIPTEEPSSLITGDGSNVGVFSGR